MVHGANASAEVAQESGGGKGRLTGVLTRSERGQSSLAASAPAAATGAVQGSAAQQGTKPSRRFQPPQPSHPPQLSQSSYPSQSSQPMQSTPPRTGAQVRATDQWRRRRAGSRQLGSGSRVAGAATIAALAARRAEARQTLSTRLGAREPEELLPGQTRQISGSGWGLVVSAGRGGRRVGFRTSKSTYLSAAMDRWAMYL